MALAHQNPNPSGIDPKEKGRAPEGCGQKEINMLNVAERAVRANPVPSEYVMSSPVKKLGIWLDDLVEKSKTKPSSVVVSLTPDMAEMLLGRNPNNRRVTDTTVENYAHEIAGGRWAFNGEPVIVSDTGELNDGQHRCLAVQRAGRAIDVVLIVGVKRDTCTTLDQGRTRTIGDYLAMEGNSYANVLGASAGYVWLFRNRGHIKSGGATRATKGEVLETVLDNPGLQRSVRLVQEKTADAAGGKSVLAFCHFILSERSREDADHFILTMMSGAGLKVGDPILYVRNRLIQERGRIRNHEKAELIFRGWNSWRKRERVSRLAVTGDILPVLES